MIYDEAFQGGGVTPPQVDAMSIMDVAAMLGRNRHTPREEWPEDAPSMFTIRRSLALREEREPPTRDDPISDDEYATLLALAKSARRIDV